MTDRRIAPGQVPTRRDSFDRNATVYASGRPPYPARVYRFMEEIGALRPGARILEIGPGTGQATVELLDRGGTVDAIELSAHPATALRDRIPDERLTIHVDDIHTTDLPGGRYDAIVAATAFHWLDTEHLLPRLAQALLPGGWLVVWWTVFGDPLATTTYRSHVDRLVRTHMPADHQPPNAIPRAMEIAERIRELTQGGLFGNVRHEEIRWTHRQDAHQARALFSTFPAVAALDAGQRAAFLGDLAAAVEAEGGLIDDPFVTEIYAGQVT